MHVYNHVTSVFNTLIALAFGYCTARYQRLARSLLLTDPLYNPVCASFSALLDSWVSHVG